MKVVVFLGAALGCALASSAFADDASVLDRIELEKSLNYQRGDVQVGTGLATIHLGDGFRYLGAADARKVVVDGWGNPPDAAGEILGMVTPAKLSPLAVGSWGVVVTYKRDGHVDDKDAAAIDYDELMAGLKKGLGSENADRDKGGFERITSIDWAQRPSYDPAAKKLIWAKSIGFAGSPEPTLNYDVRVLGRVGVLSMNAVAGVSDLKTLEPVMNDLAARTEFVSGSRYADYSPGSGDHLAAYGVAGLIGGGLAAKAGLFKVLLGLLIALKKFVVIGVIAAVAFIKKLFGGGGAAKPAAAPVRRAMPSVGNGGAPPRE